MTGDDKNTSVSRRTFMQTTAAATEGLGIGVGTQRRHQAEYLNELKQVAETTLTAIMGREAAYSGQEVTWDALIKADHDLTPPQIAFGPLTVPPIATPGRTKLNRKWNDA